MSGVRASIETIGRRFWTDERGTALTEFVITLPIFVLIFAFMAALHKHATTLNRVRYRAASNMWTAAMQVQQDGTSPTSPHGIPATASSSAGGIISGSPSQAGDTEAQTIVTAMAGGSGPEMVAGAGVMSVSASNPQQIPSKTFPKLITEDAVPKPLPGAHSKIEAVFGFARSRANGTNTVHAAIIGTRYGMVEGTDSAIANANNWGSSQMNAQYDVLVSPVSIPSDDEGYVVGASRILADQDKCLSSLLESGLFKWNDC